MVKIKCKQCEKIFMVKPSRVFKSKYCSRKCKSIAMSGSNNNFWTGTTIKTTGCNSKANFDRVGYELYFKDLIGRIVPALDRYYAKGVA